MRNYFDAVVCANCLWCRPNPQEKKGDGDPGKPTRRYGPAIHPFVSILGIIANGKADQRRTTDSASPLDSIRRLIQRLVRLAVLRRTDAALAPLLNASSLEADGCGRVGTRRGYAYRRSNSTGLPSATKETTPRFTSTRTSATSLSISATFTPSTTSAVG